MCLLYGFPKCPASIQDCKMKHNDLVETSYRLI
jgi:hypothetical protein